MGVKSWTINKLYKMIVNNDLSVVDAPSSTTGTSGGGSKARDLKKSIIKKIGLAFTSGGGPGSFVASEYDLESITNAYNTDGYVRQGVDKYIDQIFKEGYEIFGKNPNAVQYLKTRLAYIEEGTSIPTEVLFQEIAEDVVKYSNAIIAKARSNNPAQLPQGMKIQGINGGKPIAGYFPLNVTTMQINRDYNGSVLGWKQEIESGGGQPINFKAEDIIHIYYKRVKGNAFGTPFLTPVLDDIRALRQLEQSVLVMMWKYVNPFYHVSVGDKDTPGTPDEITDIEETLATSNVDGGLATTNRVTIKPIALDQVVDAEPYLKYMENRVFSGLGIPAIMFGRGNCYDEKTETLTDNGWKYYNKVTANDKIATFNPETNNIEYHYPNHDIGKFVSHHKGKMYHFKSKHVDICVSGQHEMWISTNKKKHNWHKEKAIDLYNNKYKTFYLLEQTNGISESDIIPLGNTFSIENVKHVHNNLNNNILEFETENFAKFLGYFISEGCSNIAKVKDNHYCISINQKKDNYLKEIIDIVTNLKVSYNSRVCKKGDTEISFNHKSLSNYLINNVKTNSHDARIPKEFLFSEIKIRKVLLNTLVNGDGSRDKKKRKDKNNESNFCYFTCSKALANDVQFLAISLGYQAKITPSTSNPSILYRILISKKDNNHNFRYFKSEYIQEIDYDGIMYCYNVPNHLFITRRNGRIAIQGNSANRSTGDNMTGELNDRIKAMKNTVATYVNKFIFKELLMEGGFDPIINPDDMVELKFHDSDLDKKIKAETHAIYQYEHNAITEDEMRVLIGRDPITDTAKMFLNMITIPKVQAEASARAQNKEQPVGNKETNNKQKPTNQSGTKTSPKKQTNSTNYENIIINNFDVLKDSIYLLTAKDYNTEENINKIYDEIKFFNNECNKITDDELKIYYNRLCKNLYDDIIDYINVINSTDEFKNIVDTILDCHQDNLHDIINNRKICEVTK